MRIGEAEYDLTEVLNESSLTFIRRMNRQCGIGPKTLGQRLIAIAALADPTDMSEDADLMDAFCALVWAARTHAGENLTLEQANDVRLSEVAFISDDEPEDDEPDPTTAPTGSDRGDDDPTDRPPATG